jgi:myo-inositol catabolism protein IolC
MYFLACDHRASFRRHLFGDETLSPAAAARARDAKTVVLDGLTWAIDHGADRASAGLLMDTETGADVVAAAKRMSITVAIPVERGGGGPVFEFDHGAAFGAHIERHDPDCAKALVRYNPDGDGRCNAVQRERLGELARWLRPSGRRFLLELLVPATSEQLRSVAGDVRRYDAELRPALMVRAIAQLQRDGVLPDIWKLEGLEDTGGCEMVAQQCLAQAPGVSCVVLGRGADPEQVRCWLRAAAGVPGFDGFAVGRSIWLAPLADYAAGRVGRGAAAERIGSTYLHLVRTFENAGRTTSTDR